MHSTNDLQRLYFLEEYVVVVVDLDRTICIIQCKDCVTCSHQKQRVCGVKGTMTNDVV